MTHRLPLTVLALALLTGCPKGGSDGLSQSLRLQATQRALEIELDEPPVVEAPLTMEPTEVPVAELQQPPAVSPEPSQERAAVLEAAQVLSGEPVQPAVSDTLAQSQGCCGQGATEPHLGHSLQALVAQMERQQQADLLEARLADKQRLMDRMQLEIDGMRAQSGTAVAPTGNPAVDALRADQNAANAQLAAALKFMQTENTTALERIAAQQQALADALTAQQAETGSTGAAVVGPTEPDPAAVQAAAERDAQVAALQESQAAILAQLDKVKNTRSKKKGDVAEKAEEQRLQQLLDGQKALMTEMEQSKKASTTVVAASSSDDAVARIERTLERSLDSMDRRLAGLEDRSGIVRVPDTMAVSYDPRVAELERKLDAMQVRGSSDENATVDAVESLKAQLVAMQAQDKRENELADLSARMEQDDHRLTEIAAELQASRAQRMALEAQLGAADADRRAELQTERAEAARTQAALETELGALRDRTQKMETLYTQQYASILAQLQPLIDSGLNVRVDRGEIRVQLDSDLLFASGAASVSGNGRTEIARVAEALTPFKQLLVQVEGHTDSVPVRSFRYDSNWDLAFARSKAVMQAFTDAGFAPARISAASYGDTRPIASNDTKEGRAANRRIELGLKVMASETAAAATQLQPKTPESNPGPSAPTEE